MSIPTISTAFSSAKFIKLGTQGCWEDECKKDATQGVLRLDYHEVPHDLALSNDIEALRQFFVQQGHPRGVASNHARQVLDFYQADASTVWITFTAGEMFWCSTDSPVIMEPDGTRYRKTLSGWLNHPIGKQNTDKTFYSSALSGQLTKSQAYRGTICDIKGDAFDYLLNKLEGKVLPEVNAIEAAKRETYDCAKALISKLHPKDFELFVDLVFSRSGWNRVGYLGSTVKDIDLEIENPMTGEHALVQVKTGTSKKQLKDYQNKFADYNGINQFYYVYSDDLNLESAEDDTLKLIGPPELADYAWRLGLLDWLILKCQ
jgi:hypothetical protein